MPGLSLKKMEFQKLANNTFNLVDSQWRIFQGVKLRDVEMNYSNNRC